MRVLARMYIQSFHCVREYYYFGKYTIIQLLRIVAETDIAATVARRSYFHATN